MDITENNKKIAEFLEWCKGTYQCKITNPKHPQFKIKQPIEEVFLLEDSHPIVENIYTDLPGFHWDYDKEDENGNVVNRLKFFPEDLKFHNDWNWLILVVEKIEETETKDGRTFTVDIHRDNVIINQYGKYNNEIIVTERGTRIENLYNACIEFVEWYNKDQSDDIEFKLKQKHS